jgi:flagellin
MVINTNLGALVSQRNLAESTNSLQRSLSRLATGSKIVQPQDDAAGLAMAARLEARLKRIDATQSSIANAISFVQTKDGYLGKVQSALERMSELATLAMDGTKSSTDISLYMTEFNSLREFIQSASGLQAKTFNGVALFANSNQTVYANEDATESIVLSKSPLNVAVANAASVGSVADTSLEEAISAQNHADAALDKKNLWIEIDATDATKKTIKYTNIKTSLTQVMTALEEVTSDRADLGADLSRLNTSSATLSILKENVSAATSRIKDVDVAEESASYARYSILVQAGTAMLAQANVIPQTALRLLS